MRATRLLFLLGLLPTLLAAEPAPERADPEKVVLDAMTQAGEVPKQARALVALAWPATPGDPAVAARARAEIVGFGERAIPALRTAIRQVKPAQQADVVRGLMEAFAQMIGSLPPDYLPGLEEAVWFGTEEAKRVAIPELARLQYRASVLTIVDAAHEFPDLTPLCVDALGRIGDDHARFLLEKLLNEGKSGMSEAAAAALARIRGRALLPLKAALRSPNRSVRLNAARALAPVAGVDDVSALFEYVAGYPGDDATTLEAVRQATVALEKQREAREAAAAASSAPH